MIFSYDDFDLSGITTYPLKSRASKARSEDFAKALSTAVPSYVGVTVDVGQGVEYVVQ